MPDAYSAWLSLPAHGRPPTYYPFLGIAPTELDPAAIVAAVDRRFACLRAHKPGPWTDAGHRLAAAGGMKMDWSATVPTNVSCRARDARDRFVVGRSTGAMQLLPCRRVRNKEAPDREPRAWGPIFNLSLSPDRLKTGPHADPASPALPHRAPAHAQRTP